MPRQMTQFREAASVRYGRSKFRRSHRRKMTFDASYLYPFYLDLVYPGDTFNARVDGFCRVFSPLDAPLMDDIELETAFFFVPMRLIWEHWEDFMGFHVDAGAQDTIYTIPVLNSGMTVTHNYGAYGDGELAGYFGLPHGLTTANTDVSALPFRAYNKIFDDWYRDQNVASAEGIAVGIGDGPDTVSWYDIYKSFKKHDYFTSSLPDVQKGDATQVALTGMATVLTDAALTEFPTVWSTADELNHRLDFDSTHVNIATTQTGEPLKVDFDDDAATITAGMDLNALRYGLAIQRLLEQRARGGTRYVEVIKNEFGVTSPDFRLQRAEYLGGGKSYINVSAIANTTDTDSTVSAGGADIYQGELKGIGSGRVRGNFIKSFTEHGYVIGIIRARGELTYFQGVDKHWSYSSEYDFYRPVLANIGEQPILNKELYVTGTATDDNVFAYQEPWAEMRYKKSEVVGLFNPDATGALSHWHLAEDFSTTPTYNTTFMRDNTPMSRVKSMSSVPDFAADIWIELTCARPLPVYSIPSILPARF